ncbi:MAG: YfiR family protein [Desulforhopalus sp.]|nr:YfiR family protein [Desulforhopalus sp.]
MVRAADEDLEQKVKVAFLLNFAKFTAWPEVFWPADRSDFILAIIGDDPFGLALKGVDQKQIYGKSIRLQYAGTPSADLENCQLVFVSKSEKDNLRGILSFTEGKPIVTVSDIEGFAAAGGIFEFKRKDDHLSFIINNSKARQSGIHINSSLLKLAIEVL